MNTNQDTTLTKQDIANVIAPTAFRYIPEYGNDFSYFNSMEEIKRDDHYLVTRLWDESQVLRFIEITTKASEQRMQELLEEITSQNKYLNELQIRDNKTRMIVAELTASNNQLREALSESNKWLTSGIESYELHNDNIKLLSSNPTQSLAKHNNELLDKVIKILSDNGIFGDGIIGKDILNLKATQ